MRADALSILQSKWPGSALFPAVPAVPLPNISDKSIPDVAVHPPKTAVLLRTVGAPSLPSHRGTFPGLEETLLPSAFGLPQTGPSSAGVPCTAFSGRLF